jgi:hypothetical protein
MSINDDNFSALATWRKHLINRLRDEEGTARPPIYHVVNVRGCDRTRRSNWMALAWDGNAGNGMAALAADK